MSEKATPPMPEMTRKGSTTRMDSNDIKDNLVLIRTTELLAKQVAELATEDKTWVFYQNAAHAAAVAEFEAAHDTHA